MSARRAPEAGKIRYAVVGLGHISQVAVLPAFSNADNSVLTALISDDRIKRKALSTHYRVEHTATYDEFDELLRSALVDAVYIALPNHLHCDYTIRAARAGVHVLCEKPMAVSVAECERMIQACEANSVKLMLAYRLHFESANLEAIETVQSGHLGEPRFFDSIFSIPVRPGDIRLSPIRKGGGPVFDLGVYCINAARYLFRDEPLEVMAYSESRNDDRFDHCQEMTQVLMRFPHERLASFTCSFGATSVSTYRVQGTEGSLVVDNAYEYADVIRYHMTVGDQSETRQFNKRDQFGPELFYFSNCILKNLPVEPNGSEGMADLRIVEAIHESARTREPVDVSTGAHPSRPSIAQQIVRAPTERPDEIHARGPRS